MSAVASAAYDAALAAGATHDAALAAAVAAARVAAAEGDVQVIYRVDPAWRRDRLRQSPA